MVDLVGTCPKDFWREWIAEGDAAGEPESGEEWGWFMSAPPPIGGPDRGQPYAAFIARILETRRFTLGDEKLLQAEMAEFFAAEHFAVEREKALGDGDICDFFIAGQVAVEVKIKGARRAIFRQCRRYCAHDEVKALVLATNIAMGLPKLINGKPTFVASLGAGWL
jgi:hypothetical protein